jgi:Fe-S-cluster-containing dehydrogenase component
MAKAGFLVDVGRCAGCKGCHVACKSENNTRPYWNGPGTDTASLRGSVDYRRVVFTAINRTTETDPTNLDRRFVTTACYHCDTPACRAVCPARAITKRADGVVLISYSACKGCRACQMACPYGAPRFNAVARKMEKCTYCAHNGGKPACAATCEAKALRAYDMDDGLVDVAQPSGPPGGNGSGYDDQTFDNGAAIYEDLLGTPANKHANTGPNVGFVK